MKSRFVLTPQAEQDLFEIWEHIAEGSIDNADRVRDQLFDAFQKLADMPGMGHVREDLADRRHLFWPIHSFLVVYRPDTKPLQIIAVVHGARRPEVFLALLEEE
jgi:antitoxin ParD1/3/4